MGLPYCQKGRYRVSFEQPQLRCHLSDPLPRARWQRLRRPRPSSLIQLLPGKNGSTASYPLSSGQFEQTFSILRAGFPSDTPVPAYRGHCKKIRVLDARRKPAGRRPRRCVAFGPGLQNAALERAGTEERLEATLGPRGSRRAGQGGSGAQEEGLERPRTQEVERKL
jgi:hypothetical protein